MADHVATASRRWAAPNRLRDRLALLSLATSVGRARFAGIAVLWATAAVLEGLFTAPGDGIVDYKSIFAILAQANYSGWLVQEAEQDPRVAHPLTYAELGCAHLRQLATGAKLCQKTPWLKCPPPWLRTAVRMSSGTPFKSPISSSTLLF
jgi:hypothetical protein